MSSEEKMKFCSHCGEKVFHDAVVCRYCGRSLEGGKESGSIIINNSSSASSSASAAASAFIMGRRGPFNKWVSLVLCIVLGFLGAHKFYEGKTGMGIIYIFTVGLFGIGWIVDIISIACKPVKYYLN